jgi:predicted permease
MGTVSKPFPYRLLYALAPASFRDRHGQAIDGQLRNRLAVRVRHGGGKLAFWLRAMIELAGALPALWLAAARQRGTGRLSPHEKDTPMSGLIQDLRYGLRGLYARPGMSVLCIVAIALGIGANTTVFTLANEIFLRPLAVHEPSQLIDLHVDQPGANSFVGFSYPEIEELRAAAGLMDIGAHSGTQMRLGADRSVTVSGQFNSGSYLRVLGAELAMGRIFDENEAQPGQPLVAVVSHGFWQRRLGGTDDVIGTVIELDGESATIVGVFQAGFNGRFIGFPQEVWLPLGAMEQMRPGSRLADRSNQFLEAIARLEPGTTLEAAAASINVIAAALEEQYPDTHQNRRVSLTPLTGIDSSLRAGVMGFVGVLGMLSALVLAAACLNVGNLLLARSQARAPELATRLALGAPRLRVVRQLLTETLLLFGIGAVAATVLALQLGGLLRSLIGGNLPLGLSFAVDARVLAGTALITLVTALATGLQPAWRATGPAADVLRGSRGTSTANRRLRRVFVGAQVAVSVILLVMAGLFLRALDAGRSMDPGFPTANLQLAGVTLDVDLVPEADAPLFYESLTAAIAASADVSAVGVSSSTPVGVANTPVPISAPGVAPPEGQDAFFVDAHVIDNGYLGATDIALLQGRAIETTDRADTAAVGVVNETMARQLWPDRSAVGESFTLRGREIQVVGVAADTLHLVQNQTSGPLLYLPLAQHPRHSMTLVVRSGLGSAALTQQVRAHVDRLDPQTQLRDARPQSEILDAFLIAQKVASQVAGGLGLVGLVLALTGVYGMVSFTASARRREMGIRMALGAAPERTVRLVLRSALLLVGSGAVVGLLASAAIAPLLASFLMGVSPFDPATLATVMGAMLIAAGAAAYLPARRVATIDPASTLRQE